MLGTQDKNYLNQTMLGKYHQSDSTEGALVTLSCFILSNILHCLQSLVTNTLWQNPLVYFTRVKMSRSCMGINNMRGAGTYGWAQVMTGLNYTGLHFSEVDMAGCGNYFLLEVWNCKKPNGQRWQALE